MITVADLMVTDPITLEPGDTLRFAAGVLTSLGASGAPVTVEERVVGVLTMTDILDFAANPPTPPLPRPASHHETSDGATGMVVPEGPDWDVLDVHAVEEVMSLRVLSIVPSANARQAAALMELEGVHRLMVIDDGRLLGILTAWDLVRAVARGDLVAGR